MAEKLNLSREQFFRMTEARKIKYTQVGNRLRLVDEEEVERVIAERKPLKKQRSYALG